MINNYDISCIIEPVEKRGGLYQGSIITATNMNALIQYNITSVLSVCSEFKIQYGPEINNLILDCHDTPLQEMTQLFDQAHSFLETSRQFTNVLVHCHAGKSRSSAIVISYLMKKRNLNLEQALIYVKYQRPIVSPNPGFIKQLLLYELNLYGRITSLLTESITPYFQIQQQLQAVSPNNTPSKQRTSIQLSDTYSDSKRQPLNSPQRSVPSSFPLIVQSPPQTKYQEQYQSNTPQIHKNTNNKTNTFSFQQPISVPFTVPISKEIVSAVKKNNEKNNDQPKVE
ncbi:unnamed protein product [Paramecium sonneborni]|uniref:protein-tyrosine-phosphatase n=1 Tax=Paramecium sonneborni TaxID=65129 RepID=A0A8S1QWK7_9CILI|nr:unnamed protein product [Paramecium sonneborni]